MIKTTNDIIMKNGIFGWLLLGTGVLLTIPLVAMQFTAEVSWTLSDFVIMGMLIYVTSAVFILVARKMPKHRVIAAAALGLLFVYVWAELAVGIFTNIGE